MFTSSFFFFKEATSFFVFQKETCSRDPFFFERVFSQHCFRDRLTFECLLICKRVVQFNKSSRVKMSLIHPLLHSCRTRRCDSDVIETKKHRSEIKSYYFVACRTSFYLVVSVQSLGSSTFFMFVHPK